MEATRVFSVAVADQCGSRLCLHLKPRLHFTMIAVTNISNGIIIVYVCFCSLESRNKTVILSIFCHVFDSFSAILFVAQLGLIEPGHVLQEWGLPIVSLATCQATYGNQLVDNGLEIDGQICAGFEERATNEFPGTFEKGIKNRLVFQENFSTGSSIISRPFYVKYCYHEKFKSLPKKVSRFLTRLLHFMVISCRLQVN